MSIEYPKPKRLRGEAALPLDGAEELAFWESADEPITLREEGDGAVPVYDLLERTAKFGETVIQFAKRVPRGAVNTPLISQIVRSGTSVGANYCEADDAVSKKEFKNKIGACRKEAKETKYWLRMIASAEESLKPAARVVWQEARELHPIFCSIFNRS